MKVCKKCLENKSIDNYYVNTNDRGYKFPSSICKQCTCLKHRQKRSAMSEEQRQSIRDRKKSYNVKNRDKSKNRELKRNFNISYDIFLTMKVSQNNLCAICKKQESALSNDGYIKELAVDHCHKTGKIRGLLCSACNIGIGKFKECVDNLEQAITYLKKYQD